MLAAFCPETPTHVGQPADVPDDDESDSDLEQENPKDEEWQWELGVVQALAADPSRCVLR